MKYATANKFGYCLSTQYNVSRHFTISSAEFEKKTETINFWNYVGDKGIIIHTTENITSYNLAR